MKTVTLATVLMLLLSLPFVGFAQYDDNRGLFGRGPSSGNVDYGTRDGLIGINDNTGGASGGITNDSFGAPLGSGLAILLAAGVGYAVVRRKRTRKNTTLLLACVALLGFTQCKKGESQGSEPEVKTVGISLKVGGTSGSRHTINTTTGAVGFEEHDLIYVGNGGKYIGTLECNNSGVFTGDINEPIDNTEMYFYFVGGLTPNTTPSAGSTSSFTVDISDQSSKIPVLSCNHLTYHSGTASYSCVLQNQCALVKFITTNTSAPVHVGGLYTVAKIDFENNSITNNGTTGFVALNSASATEKWAVLLPQTSFSGAEGVVADHGYTVSMPAIEADAFFTGDDAISISSTPSHNRYLQWATGNLTLEDGDHVYGTLSGNYKVEIENKAGGATVTLDNVTINGVNNDSYQWAGLNCMGSAKIVLADGTTNTVKGFQWNYPGIHVPSGSTLTIQGTGSLNASSNGYGAGIGGGINIDCGNITINGGIVTATGSGAAGIGGGCASSCGTITISGGTIDAIGGPYAAGIGTGSEGASCGDITIENTVTRVTATRGEGAPNSIGNGDDGTCGTVKFENVTIDPNSVTAGNYGGLNLAISGSTWTLTPVPAPAGAIDGKFTINDSGGKVYFSQGNLQATTTDLGAHWTWSFATNQWDCIGGRFILESEPQTGNNFISGNGIVSANGTVDLFGWSTSTTYYGIYYSGSSGSYSGPFVDWGSIAIGSDAANTWHTLTKDEWKYLFESRTDAGNKYGKATVNGIHGVVLLPDGWSIPDGCYFTAGYGNGWDINIYDASAWNDMEANGAVFLPAAGVRRETSVSVVGSNGQYWSSTSSTSTYAYYMFFGNSSMYDHSLYRCNGRSVRLVRDAN